MRRRLWAGLALWGLWASGAAARPAPTIEYETEPGSMTTGHFFGAVLTSASAGALGSLALGLSGAALDDMAHDNCGESRPECSTEARVTVVGAGLGQMLGAGAGVAAYGHYAKIVGSASLGFAGAATGAAAATGLAYAACGDDDRLCGVALAAYLILPATAAVAGYALGGPSFGGNGGGHLIEIAPASATLGVPTVSATRWRGETRVGISVLGGRFQ
jgi:hypothetical protein